MESKHVIRSWLKGDYSGGPWGTGYNYSSETELISGTSTPEYKSQRIIVAESTGLWLIVVHFKLNGASTSAFEQWKQKNKVTPIVTNSAGTELTGHVWPSQITLGIPNTRTRWTGSKPRALRDSLSILIISRRCRPRCLMRRSGLRN